MNKNYSFSIIVCLLIALAFFSTLFFLNKSRNTSGDSAVSAGEAIQGMKVEEEQIKPKVEASEELGNDDNLAIQTNQTGKFPKELLLELSNGREVLVTYKLDDSLNLPRPVRETFDTYIFDLIELADEGVPAAATSVYALLRQCSTVPRSRADFEIQAQQFLSSGVFGAPAQNTQGQEFSQGSDEFNQAYQDLQLQYKLCSKITDLHLEQKSDYRELAFERDEFGVLSEEAMASFDSNPDRFYELSERSWKLGNVGALSSISFSYTLGIPPSTRGKPDHTTAYAYELASFAIQERLLSESQKNIHEIDALRIGLEQAGSKLTPQDQERASTLADEIIEENSNCCISIWPGE